jgi:hypothetical protein
METQLYVRGGTLYIMGFVNREGDIYYVSVGQGLT